MKKHKRGRWWAAALCVLPVALLGQTNASAAPGDFWYGLYNVQHGPNSTWKDTVWQAMAQTYRMNWALTAISEADGGIPELARAKAAGIDIMQWGVREPGTTDDDAVINTRYSNAAYLHFQAEGDTILYQFEPFDYWCVRAGVFVRHNSAGAGRAVFDTVAERDSAWLFDPAVADTLDSIYVDFAGLGEDMIGKTYFFPFMIRAVATNCEGELAHLSLMQNTSGSACYPNFVTRSERSLTCADFVDTSYHPFDLSFVPSDEGDEWNLRLVLRWTGKAKLWVDYVGVRDEPGGELIAQPSVANAIILGYANRYSFGGDLGVIGFYMREESFQDANVYPQFRVDSLLTWGPGLHLTPFTEHNNCYWWGDRQTFGGRNTASARMEYKTPVSACFYPYAGYHFENSRMKEYPYAASVDTVLAVLGTDPCPSGDTAVCLQTQIDNVASVLNLYKRMSVSTSKKFMPFLQAYSSNTRLTPADCHVDTTGFVWQIKTREPTENETKLEASIALAHGANGLLFWVGGSFWNEFTTIPCDGGTIPWQTVSNHRGFTDLSGVKDACHGFVGPLVDSLGHFFADFAWQGAGRLDPQPSGIQGCFVDSVKSLTLPDGGVPYIEGGFYKLGADDYFLLVNRRAYDAIPQTIRVHMSIPSDSYVIDQYSHDTLSVPVCAGHGSLDVTLPPGEGKLFRLVPLGWTTPNLALRSNTDGTSYDDRYGWAVSSVGDVDADGTPDYGVGAPWADPYGVTDAGLVYVYSGRTGQLLECVRGMQAGAGLGWSICALGDVNGDGYDDFVAGAPGWDEGGVGADVGWVGIISGANTTALHYWAGTGNYDSLGVSVAGVGDLGTDGKADFIAGAPGWDNYGTKVDVGAVYVCSGAGSPLGPPSGGALAGDHFGYSVAAADVDGNGRKEFVIGAPYADNAITGADAGAIFVGQWRRNGDGPGARLGWSVACAGDIHGDGNNEDILVGAPYTIPSGGPDSAGVAYVFPGELTFATVSKEDPSADYIHKKTGSNIGDRLGWSVAGAGDVNGDCRSDFCVGAPGVSAGGATNAGATYIYSGNGGIQLSRIDGQLSGDELGRSVAAAVRPFGQLAAYVISGMPFADRGDNGDAGSATVAGLASSCNCPNQGDLNTDGVIDLFDVIGIIGIALSGDPDPRDPLCPTTRGDVNFDGGTDVFDIIYLIGTAFSGGDPPVNPCAP